MYETVKQQLVQAVADRDDLAEQVMRNSEVREICEDVFDLHSLVAVNISSSFTSSIYIFQPHRPHRLYRVCVQSLESGSG